LSVRRLAVACLLLAVAAGAARAADAPIDPDRPDASSSTATVSRGRVQLEAGILFERTRAAAAPTERRLSAETTLRVGVAESLEVRLEGEPVVRLRGADDATDVGDLKLSAKWRFFDPAEGVAWPALALSPFVKLPTAPEPIGSGKADAGLILIGGFDLPARLALDVNAGLAAIGQTRPGGHLLQALASASLSRRVARGVSAFAELFFASREERDGREAVGLAGGLLWIVAPDVALDGAVGTSLHGALPDVFVRAGGSVRFGR
jgi:hypothetical protein